MVLVLAQKPPWACRTRVPHFSYHGIPGSIAYQSLCPEPVVHKILDSSLLSSSSSSSLPLLSSLSSLLLLDCWVLLRRHEVCSTGDTTACTTRTSEDDSRAAAQRRGSHGGMGELLIASTLVITGCMGHVSVITTYQFLQEVRATCRSL